MSPFFCLKTGKGFPKLFSGPIPEKYKSTFHLGELFYNAYYIDENTRLEELCERDMRIKRSLQNFIESSVTNPELHPLNGKSRREIRNRYSCSDPKYFDKIIDSLIKEDKIAEMKGGLYPPEELNERVVGEKLLPLILSHEDKGAYKIIKQWDKPDRWKKIGKEIIEDMKAVGSLKIVNGKLRPYFVDSKILKFSYHEGKIEWYIGGDRRWPYWRDILTGVRITSKGGYDKNFNVTGHGKIDPSQFKTGECSLSISFEYLVHEEERRTDLEETVIEERKITVPPRVKVYQSSEISEKILEVTASPDTLGRINFQMFEAPDSPTVSVRDMKWIEKSESSYARFERKSDFFPEMNEKDLSSWMEERSLRSFFTELLKISMSSADGPGQNCKCEIEADSVILDIFERDLCEMIDLHINCEKKVEEKSKTRCLFSWEAKRSEYPVKVGIDFKEGPLPLEEKTIRVPFPEPKIELLEDSS